MEVSGIFKAKVRFVRKEISLNPARFMQVIRDSPAWAHDKDGTYIDGTSLVDAWTATLFLNVFKDTFLDKAMGFPTIETARGCFLFWRRDDGGTIEDDIHFLTQQTVTSLARCSLFDIEEGYIRICMP